MKISYLRSLSKSECQLCASEELEHSYTDGLIVVICDKCGYAEGQSLDDQ